MRKRLRAAWARHTLDFIFTARTSRETMTRRPTWFIRLWHPSAPQTYGIGECAHFAGLSAEPTAEFESKLAELCRAVNCGRECDLSRWSSLRMGYESALLDLDNGGRRILYPGSWTRGESAIAINGLVWMGSVDEMLCRIDSKLAAGFRCLKMKIGGVDFDRELELLRHVREAFSASQLIVRLDANGAFSQSDALTRLEKLARFEIHSIEQPIMAGQREAMARICRLSPIAVALDEELIGVVGAEAKASLLDEIAPQYIILKPTLCGGLSGAGEWIDLAQDRLIGWWVTSALESNVGLNAIAQWTASMGVTLPQGLGTGQLYSNNIESPLWLDGDELRYNPDGRWIFPELEWQM